MLNLKAFTLGALGNCHSMIKHAQKSGLTLDELLSEVERALQENKPKIPTAKQIKAKEKEFNRTQRIPEIRCTECQQTVMVLSVNDSPSTMIGGNYKSVLLCQNPACKHSEYRTKSVKEIHDMYRG